MMVIYNWYELLYSFFIYTVIIPIGLGTVRWRFMTSSERWVVFFLVALLVDELLSVLCIAFHMRNHFLYHIQTLTVLCTVAGVYNQSIGRDCLVWKIALAGCLLMVLEVGFWVGFNHINSLTLAFSRVLPAIYAVISLHRVLLVTGPRLLMSKPMLFIHCGFFIFGAFTAVNAYFMSYFIETSLDLFFLFQNMSAMLSAVSFMFFSFGFWRIKTGYKLHL